MFKYCFTLIALPLGLICCKTTKYPDQNHGYNNELKIAYTFPFQWIGHYEGELFIYDGKSDTLSVNMQLIIDNPNAEGYYPWTIIYGKDDFRYYGLEVIDSEKGHYKIDEFNRIKIDAYLRQNHFVSRFSVLNSDLLIDYEKVDNGIKVHLYATSSEALSETGGDRIAQDTVPNVRSYPFGVVQNALLKKKTN